MKYLFIFIFLIPLGFIRAQNNLVQISGELHDQKTGEALFGAIILETLTLGNTIGSNKLNIRSAEIIPAQPSVPYIISASPTISDLTLSSKI